MQFSLSSFLDPNNECQCKEPLLFSFFSPRYFSNPSLSFIFSPSFCRLHTHRFRSSFLCVICSFQLVHFNTKRYIQRERFDRTVFLIPSNLLPKVRFSNIFYLLLSLFFLPSSFFHSSFFPWKTCHQ